jgi:hypothetical protein
MRQLLEIENEVKKVWWRASLPMLHPVVSVPLFMGA